MSDGASLLRVARRRAKLTQVDLAVRAGVTQSVISAYESGHRQPSLTTLSALIQAAGFDLDLRLVPVPRRLDVLSGPIGARVRQHRRSLIDAAAARGVHNLRVFGSVARGEDGPDSDLDLLVDLPPDIGLIGLGQVQDDLEQLLGVRVDLVPAADLKEDIRDRVARDLIAL
jgi:predicted nucleotidyltransferase/DNA-binding XRE family transcriptional regulator